MKTILLLIVLFPLLGALFHAVIGRRVPRRAVETIACATVFASLTMAVVGFLMAGRTSHMATLHNWFTVGDFSIAMDVLYDPLAAIMVLMVTLVGALIHVYSVSFMRKESDYVRYFCYLNLFVFSMLVIVLSDNLLFLYLGWEGVGFCSYALIGFWYSDVGRARAGRKAFILTRIGDVALTVAIALFFVTYGSHLSISYINAHTTALSAGMPTVLGLLLLWAAIGKSAQLPLTVWLPDAMAGPTPVSALIHAATMVTAGAYLLMRLFPVLSLSPAALLVIAIVGAITAFYSACSALTQKDIKRVLAYSTISQVSYMFLAIGVGDIVSSMFLLLSHAFFKALLFLSAGCVIQALNDEHDIFRMGNLHKLMPMVYWLFLIGALSLSAFPLIGGYFSKDRILLATFIHPGAVYKGIWAVAIAGALLTPLYTMRLFFIAFPNRPEGPKKTRGVPMLMQWMLWPLAILALGDGLLNLPFGPGKQWLAHYLSTVPGVIESLNAPYGVALGMGVGDALGVLAVILLAYFLYRPGRRFLSRPTPVAMGAALDQLLFTGFYLDEWYRRLILEPYRAISSLLWTGVDERGLDDGITQPRLFFPYLSLGFRLWTTGRLTGYLKMVLLGLAAILGGLLIFH